jgi:hypothetical protein
MSDGFLYMRCPACTNAVKVPETQWHMFVALNCPLCQKPLDRRGRPVVSTPKPTADVTAEDAKLLGDLKIKWSEPDGPA